MNRQQKQPRIHSPILRIFVQLFGTSGLQLSPLRCFNCKTTFIFVINIIINILLFYSTYIDTGAFFEQMEFNSKKLYAYFQSAHYFVFFPSMYIGLICTYLLYGHRIIMILDSSVFICINDCRMNRLKAFLLYAIMKIIWDEQYWCREFRNHIFDQFDVRRAKVTIGAYIFHTSTFINSIILYYHQIIMFFTLQQIIDKLTTNNLPLLKTNSFSLEQRLFRSIVILSKTNRHFQYYCSIMLSLLLIYQADYLIVFLSYWILHPGSTEFLGITSFIEQINRLILFTGLVLINRQNIQLFDRIDHHFRLKHAGKHHHPHYNLNTITTTRRKRYTKYNQLQIYRQYFQLSIFNWLNFDLSLVLHLFFFSMGYVLIISQTTD
ncbi:uncharacterized protein LOC124497285 isoform X1 [Dermatophagoides farinae]|uniref:uncharacterized protein LOC124497285 isoform X1 n=1 Tax=Dermatophagoides farinae TaxID=6954 RepID=UPI003F5F5E93